jgi:hypothetical protein
MTCDRPVQRDGKLVSCGKPSATVLLDRGQRIPVCSGHEGQTSEMLHRGLINTFTIRLPE